MIHHKISIRNMPKMCSEYGLHPKLDKVTHWDKVSLHIWNMFNPLHSQISDIG